MPIEFACSSCNLRYSVKDELAGRTAKCGKCGHRMRIPHANAAKSVASLAPASKPAPPVSKSKAPAPKSMASDPKSARPAAKPTSGTPATPGVAANSSWLDEELEIEQPAIAALPPPPGGNSCPSCGKPLDKKAVLCVSCGYDTRTGEKRETQHVIESSADAKKSAARSKAADSGSILLGTLFSFIGAMIGALIWAVIVYLTHYELGYVAIGLGALCGWGMNLGYDPDDGTFAGIISAFMSFVGIVAAKMMIIVIIVSAAVGSMIGELDAENIDPAEMNRQMAAVVVAENNLEKQRINVDEITDEQWEAAIDAAQAELAGLDAAAIDKKLKELAPDIQAEDHPNGENSTVEEVPHDPAAADTEMADAEVESAETDPAADAAPGADAELEIEEPSFVKLFFTEMFSPIDGLFILLAFFTAYKVGSGEMTD
jgi:hypothetical protein